MLCACHKTERDACICRYNLLTNNCEHFARWCKTGHKRSMQSESFFRSLTKRAITLLVAGSKWLFFSPEGNAALKYGAKAVGYAAATNAVKDVGKQAMFEEVGPHLPASKFVGPALIIGREIQMVYDDIREAHRQRREGNISRRECIKITMKRTAEGCGSLAGVAVALAIPFTRNCIGCTLGAVIGQGAGVMIGRRVCGLYDRKSAE